VLVLAIASQRKFNRIQGQKDERQIWENLLFKIVHLNSYLQLVSQPAYRRQQLRIGEVHFDAGAQAGRGHVAFLLFINTAVTYLKALIR
jgi:hypothetical protein